MAAVLKRKHSLKGASLLPLVKRIRANTQPITVWARLSKDVDTTNMSKEDFNLAVKWLTGRENDEEVAQMVQDGESNVDMMRKVLHFAILQANERGQQLQEVQAGQEEHHKQGHEEADQQPEPPKK